MSDERPHVLAFTREEMILLQSAVDLLKFQLNEHHNAALLCGDPDKIARAEEQMERAKHVASRLLGSHSYHRLKPGAVYG
ncbi:hypothetical protein [Enterovirga aerilata]|uniref:Uncharacterized protein n=1 Tax=Enterovirga aerilata TaxID=2730920 RepID=A0A849ILF9_9HYPH|nr:hypothetical protein [Enterovirga sp. DB1703]NNM74793.1 hypothetical protein [Enterovirga sp. DB1703]